MIHIQYIVAFIIFYFAIYSLTCRICNCIEHCATARAYAKFRENGVMVKTDDIEAGIKKVIKEKNE